MRNSNAHGIERISIPAPPSLLERSSSRTVRSSRPTRRGLLGSGLSGKVVAGIVIVTTAAFLFWGGPLWDAAPGTSHVLRIAGSYLLALPLVWIMLRIEGRPIAMYFPAALAVVWSAKLVVTATAYAYLAPGSATIYAPDRPWERPGEPGAGSLPTAPPAAASGEVGDIGGIVRHDQAKGELTVIVTDVESIGSANAAVEVPVSIEASRYTQPIYAASSGDRLIVESRDRVLHTFRIARDGRAVANIPVPETVSTRMVPAPEPGIYEVTCANHATEHAALLVDRRFFAGVDDAGRFELRGVPAGAHELAVLRSGKFVWRRPIVVAENRRLDLSIEWND
jgi:hypothetical protein